MFQRISFEKEIPSGGYRAGNISQTSSPNPLLLLAYYTRSLLEDSRLFGRSPWKILAATYEQMGY